MRKPGGGVAHHFGLYIIDAATGTRKLVQPMDEEDPLSPRYQALDWDPRGEGSHLTYASRTKWECGLARYDGKAKKFRDLIKDGRLCSDFRIFEDGVTFVVACAEAIWPPDLLAADAASKNVRRLTYGNHLGLPRCQVGGEGALSTARSDAGFHGGLQD
jgi:hypothetical protein